MDQIELLYINFLEHPWLSGLEINFSQEMAFTFNEKNQLIISKLDTLNIFSGAITNLNVIVGKNGVGKTTILNEIYELLHGSVKRERIVVIKKNKCIYVYFKDKEIEFNIQNAKSMFVDYSFKVQKNGFYLNTNIDEHNKFDYNKEIYNLLYISEFTDMSVNSKSFRNENNHAFNYSPFSLIETPDSFLNYKNSIQNSFKKSISNFRIISKIHQISFLLNNKNIFDFKSPSNIEISFNDFIYQLEERAKSNIYINKGYLQELIHNLLSRKRDLKLVFDAHLILSLYNLLDISQYIFDEEKARIQNLNLKNKGSSEINEIRQDAVLRYNTGLKKLLIKFSKGNFDVVNVYTEYENLLRITNIESFYSDFDELSSNQYTSLNLINKLSQVVGPYIEIIFIIKNRGKRNSGLDINVDLIKAGGFLQNYLLLRNHAEFNNEATLCMPSEIKYFSGDKEFYFSSGQEQMIRLFNYIDISTKNVEKINSKEKNSFVILMDEPDNAFHPEMQKDFIKSLSDFLNHYNQCTFHIILTTHSPIITSDLTKNHVVFLEKVDNSTAIRSVKNQEKPNTFAQNIYNLYKESFFINDGLMGSYADEILSKLYKQLGESRKSLDNAMDNNFKKTGKKNFKESEIEKLMVDNLNPFSIEEMEFLINEIGEPIIKKKFEDMFYKLNK
ncbi:ATP-binding protein, partial [Bacillus thuringiensis]|uniref:ATP-binding protein n=1 Tax=Bacillus thuringiensis TaxID=1428 RepID=UPI001E59C7F5